MFLMASKKNKLRIFNSYKIERVAKIKLLCLEMAKINTASIVDLKRSILTDPVDINNGQIIMPLKQQQIITLYLE